MSLITRRTIITSAAFGKQMVAAAAPARASHIVFVLGDHEYSGEQTLPLVAANLEKRYGYRCSVRPAVPDQNAETNIPGLDALRTADLAIFYLRWRRLPAAQINEIAAYMKTGKPMIGFRTTSHAFRYPDGDPLQAWNHWAAEAFGAPPGWGADGHTHYGHEASTDVAVLPAARQHPVLSGVESRFHVRSWLYQVLPKWPPLGATRLLEGTAVNPNRPAEPNPVAWVWTNGYNARTFFTTMGHPEDFQTVSFQRLIVNAIAWCLDEKPRWKGPVDIRVPYRGMMRPAR